MVPSLNRASLMGGHQSFSHSFSFANFSLSVSIMSYFLFLISTVVLLPSIVICIPNMANAFAYLFSLRWACSIPNVQISLPFSGLTSCKGPGMAPSRNCFLLPSRLPNWSHLQPSSAGFPSREPLLASLSMPSTVLFEHENSNLNDSAIISLSP